MAIKNKQKPMELKNTRIALEKIKKTSLLTSNADQKYDYEKFKFKVVAIGEETADKTLIGKTIIKQANLGIEIDHEGKELIIIREEDILAII